MKATVCVWRMGHWPDFLARAVVVIGKNGKVAYTELVPEITQEPDYDKAIAAVKK